MTDIRLDGNDQLSGADAFAAWAACSLDDCRDPVEGFDATMLGELVTAAETFAVEVRTILNRGDQYTTWAEVQAGYDEIPTDERAPDISGYVEQLVENGLISDALLDEINANGWAS